MIKMIMVLIYIAYLNSHDKSNSYINTLSFTNVHPAFQYIAQIPTTTQVHLELHLIRN